MNNKLLIGMGVLMLLGVASAKSATSVAKPALASTAVHHMTAKPAVHTARVSTHKRTKQAARTHRIHQASAKKNKR